MKITGLTSSSRSVIQSSLFPSVCQLQTNSLRGSSFNSSSSRSLQLPKKIIIKMKFIEIIYKDIFLVTGRRITTSVFDFYILERMSTFPEILHSAVCKICTVTGYTICRFRRTRIGILTPLPEQSI